jgi:hypothetical protein
MAGTLEHISNEVSFGKGSGTIFEITKLQSEPDSVQINQASEIPWALWGKDNNFPQRLIDNNRQEVASIGALGFKVRAHYGKGPYLYRRSIVDNKVVETPVLLETLSPEIQDFWFRNDIENFCQAIIKDFEWFNHYYVQYVLSKADKIYTIKRQRNRDVRSGKRDKQSGIISKYYLSPYFGVNDGLIINRNKIGIPAFDKFNPTLYPSAIYQHHVPSVDRDYYPEADWHSNIAWLKVAIKIPQWIIANIDNSVNIKYHVEIPEKYFLDLFPLRDFPEEKGGDKARYDAMKKHEEDLKVKIDECLTGADNAQKIFYTKFAVDSEGNILPGWKINPITNDLKDGAWLNAYSTAAVASLTAHGVSATTTNLSLPSALNVGSGSDMREKFNFHMQLNTVIPRQTTTEWWEIVKRVNGWDPTLKLGYENVILDTLDNNKAGFEQQNEPTPTTVNK